MSLHTSSCRRRSLLNWVFTSLSYAIILIYSFTAPSLASDTLFKGNSIPTNGSLVSNRGVFKLGFFTVGPKRGYYLGISYNISVQTIVWVANRETPVDESGVLRIGSNGDLEVVNGSGTIFWSSNSTLDNSNCSAQIRDDGNLVLTSGRNQNLWASFDNPTDTFIPGMKLTVDRSTGETLKLVSWKSPDDPSPGRFSLSLDPKGSAQIFIYNGSKIWWRSGQWNRKNFIGQARVRPLASYGFNLDPNDNGKIVLKFSYDNPFLRFVMQWNGVENTSLWTPENGSWTVASVQPLTECETYNFCGNDSLCINERSPNKCGCLQGFIPQNEGQCIRRIPLNCGENGTAGGFGYAKFDQVKLPDFSEWASSPSDESTCRSFCSSNCSCKAFSYVEDVGCLIWTVDLVDLAKFPENGNAFFLKLDSSDLDLGGVGNNKKILSISLPIVVAVILLISVFIIWKYKTSLKGRKVKSESALGGPVTLLDVNEEKPMQSLEDSQDNNTDDSFDLPIYSFDALAAATDGFSDDRKLGRGGFGVVYKGVLPSGEEIAVKRLSKNSSQGLEEFKNEVTLIANLQHRNLVRLFGCCFQGEEKILVYEYMANKSLDSLLFDPERKLLLDWGKRFDIIEGVARGLLYLHRDSRLRIVHRDLKASNILLDEQMNPKISDFGMARMFGGDQNHDNTNRVVGTVGYMSPEYAMEGLFSEKSDVYSFGVLTLEILSGRKNVRTWSENYTNLLGYAWQLWAEGRPEDLIDPCTIESCDVPQAVRCIHIGLLCVQNLIKNRPAMSKVIIYLSSQNPIGESPEQPTFVVDSGINETVIQKLNEEQFSTNEVTVTELSAR